MSVSRVSRMPSPATIALGVVVLVVMLGGTSYASATLAANSVGAHQLKSSAVTNAKIASHAVTGGKVAASTLTASNFKPGTLLKGDQGIQGIQGDKGTKGDQGIQGVKGDTGEAGSARGWAVVSAAGVVQNSGGSTYAAPTVTKKGTGQYCLSGSGWDGSYTPEGVSVLGSDVTNGQASVNNSYGSNTCSNGNQISTFNGSGDLADRQFLVYVL